MRPFTLPTFVSFTITLDEPEPDMGLNTEKIREYHSERSSSERAQTITEHSERGSTERSSTDSRTDIKQLFKDRDQFPLPAIKDGV